MEGIDYTQVPGAMARQDIESQIKKVVLLDSPEIYMNLHARIALPKKFLHYADRIKNFEVRENDIWLISFPKSGSTWSQEMLWLMSNDVNTEAAYNEYLHVRFPILELSAITNYPGIPDSVDCIDRMDKNRQRLIKTHLPLPLLPAQLFTKNPKIIYVQRDPKDVVLSYSYMNQLFCNSIIPLEEFMEDFLQDKVVYAPYWPHVLAFWRMRDDPNVLFNTFAEMKQDIVGVITKTAQFLGVSLADEQLAIMVNHLDIENMRLNPMVNLDDFIIMIMQIYGKDFKETPDHFIRRGEKGGWKNIMSDEWVARFDAWTYKALEGTDFPYEYTNEPEGSAGTSTATTLEDSSYKTADEVEFDEPLISGSEVASDPLDSEEDTADSADPTIATAGKIDIATPHEIDSNTTNLQEGTEAIAMAGTVKPGTASPQEGTEAIAMAGTVKPGTASPQEGTEAIAIAGTVKPVTSSPQERPKTSDIQEVTKTDDTVIIDCDISKITESLGSLTLVGQDEEASGTGDDIVDKTDVETYEDCFY